MSTAAEQMEAVASDYVRVKRKTTTIFLYTTTAVDTASDLKAKINTITKVPAGDMKLFIDKNGDVPLDENKTLADQKVENDQELFLVYRKEGCDEWDVLQPQTSCPFCWSSTNRRPGLKRRHAYVKWPMARRVAKMRGSRNS